MFSNPEDDSRANRALPGDCQPENQAYERKSAYQNEAAEGALHLFSFEARCDFKSLKI